MTKRVDITVQESENVERLFNEYNAYLSILSYFGDKATDTTVFDRKWAEAVQLSIELDKAKRTIEAKYKPEGEWDSFQFDFEKYQVVFFKDEA